jgi:hypothetical protein
MIAIAGTLAYKESKNLPQYFLKSGCVSICIVLSFIVLHGTVFKLYY